MINKMMKKMMCKRCDKMFKRTTRFEKLCPKCFNLARTGKPKKRKNANIR